MLTDERDITVCLTSCGRWNLLEKTISSLLSNWDGKPPAAFYIHDDSGALDVVLVKELDSFLMRHWQIMAEWSNTNRKGQVHAIDTLKTYLDENYEYYDDHVLWKYQVELREKIKKLENENQVWLLQEMSKISL